MSTIGAVTNGTDTILAMNILDAVSISSNEQSEDDHVIAAQNGRQPQLKRSAK
jgi:hypothetical protein